MTDLGLRSNLGRFRGGWLLARDAEAELRVEFGADECSAGASSGATRAALRNDWRPPVTARILCKGDNLGAFVSRSRGFEPSCHVNNNKHVRIRHATARQGRAKYSTLNAANNWWCANLNAFRTRKTLNEFLPTSLSDTRNNTGHVRVRLNAHKRHSNAPGFKGSSTDNRYDRSGLNHARSRCYNGKR